MSRPLIRSGLWSQTTTGITQPACLSPRKGRGEEIALASFKSNEISILVWYRVVGNDEALALGVPPIQV